MDLQTQKKNSRGVRGALSEIPVICEEVTQS